MPHAGSNDEALHSVLRTRRPVGVVGGPAYTLQANNGQGVVFPSEGARNTLTASDGGADPSNLGRVVCVTGNVTHTLTHEGSDASEDGTGRGTPIIAFGCKDSDPHGEEGVSPTLRAMQGRHANGGGQVAIATEFIVRRLLPIECERLMNWPDDSTRFKMKNGQLVEQADAPRYKQIGNGVVKACARYVARRLKKVMESIR